MDFLKLKISVKSLMNLMNLMNHCKSVSYNQKSLIILIKFIKMPYLLRLVNCILMRMMRTNQLKMNILTPFINSSKF